ncbi:MAG: ABC transporter ATP-binding protein [Thaumarchaeota archaeon]|jgi:peptide/nickel transport system ATP-binding protein|nr:ABC transporter ATP-binding protein [Candidatus Terraquivivens yellowstonensis]
MSDTSLNLDEQLKVKDLVVRFYTYEGIVKAVEKASLKLRKGETLGIVGETGSGKSVTALTIIALTPSPGKVEDGKILLRKSDDSIIDILKMSEAQLLKIRGREISMIFQEPNAALDPVCRVGEQIAEAILAHRRMEMIKKSIELIEDEKKNGRHDVWTALEMWAYREMLNNSSKTILKILLKLPIIRNTIKRKLNHVVRQEIIELLRLMEIPDPERVIDAYPHELSGGMQQRIVIAIALACSPLLLIADEPTTNLDVTVQAQILDLINRLKEKFGSSIIYITHDMGVIAEISDRVAVMYAGSVVEVAYVKELFRNPLHPYTKGLLESIPRPGTPLKSIPGNVPNLVNPPSGCRFHPRCAYMMEKCKEVVPRLIEVSKDHYVACLLYGGGE